MTFICCRKSLVVMCMFHRAHCLSLGHESDLSVLISRSPLNTSTETLASIFNEGDSVVSVL